MVLKIDVGAYMFETNSSVITNYREAYWFTCAQSCLVSFYILETFVLWI